ncbi:hypothetical protein [Neobacillus drentensis]
MKALLPNVQFIVLLNLLQMKKIIVFIGTMKYTSPSVAMILLVCCPY